jgi:hypothetical protein
MGHVLFFLATDLLRLFAIARVTDFHRFFDGTRLSSLDCARDDTLEMTGRILTKSICFV